MKLARHETGRQNIIHFKGGFHGRSLTTLAMTTSKGVYRVNYGPLPSGFHQAPYPYCVQCDSRPAGGGCCGSPLQAIKELFKETTSPGETAAIVLEPILGEGGYVVPPAGFMTGLRKLCDEHGILLVADEVQSVSYRGEGMSALFVRVWRWLSPSATILSLTTHQSTYLPTTPPHPHPHPVRRVWAARGACGRWSTRAWCPTSPCSPRASPAAWCCRALPRGGT